MNIGSDLERRCRPHHFALVQNQCASHSIIFMVDEEVLLVTGEGPHGQQKLGEVVAVQGAGLGWQPTGQVSVPNTHHPLHQQKVAVITQLLSKGVSHDITVKQEVEEVVAALGGKPLDCVLTFELHKDCSCRNTRCRRMK